MFQNKRGTRSEGTRRRRFTYRLRPELLESRDLMTGVNIDLSQVASQPYGVLQTGFQAGGGVGWSVTDVGDLTGSGYDDFVVGAPSVLRNGTNVVLGNSQPPGVAYLIFGSAQVNGGTVTSIDWASLAAQGRIGDLALLGNSTQTNPANGNQGFAYAGVKITSDNQNSRLGASVTALGDINGSGFNSFMIGAPGANDATGGNAGTGRAYIIYGGPALKNVTTIDVDQPSTVPTNIVTLVSARPASRLGSSGAGVGDVITDGFPDIAVGAPGTTIAGNANAGAVYLISGTALRNPAFGAVFNVDTVGQSNLASFVPGITFTGVAPGDQAGFSLGGTNIDGATTSANQSIDDLLIGAPQTGTGNGLAYLVYGGINLQNFATLDPNMNILSVSLNRIGDSSVTAARDVPGVTVTGAANGDLVGYSIGTAGNFTSTSFDDVLIGGPAANGGTGAVYVLVGAPVASRPLGDVPLSAIPSTSTVLTLRGASNGDQVGYSVTQTGRINNDVFNEVAIGAPGFNSGYGAVYLIPGSSAIGTQSTVYPLANATSAALNANVITVPSGAAGSIGPAALGSSVSGFPFIQGRARTLDNDTIGDLIIGAPGFSLATIGSNPPSTSRNAAGGVFALEGTFLRLGVAGTGNSANASIVTTIGINSQTAPFTIDASKNQMLIYVFDTTGFNASTDIDPTTIVVNGVAYPNATLTPGNGFAIITISPVSALGLSNGNATITIRGVTTTAAGAQTFTGSASATVTNAGNNGGGTGFAAGLTPVGFQTPTTFPPPNGERLLPTLNQLVGPDGYTPLPANVSPLGQFYPNKAYIQRTKHGVTTGHVANNLLKSDVLITKFGHFRDNRGFLLPKKQYASYKSNTGVGVHTLPSRVFTHNPAKPVKAAKPKRHK